MPVVTTNNKRARNPNNSVVHKGPLLPIISKIRKHTPKQTRIKRMIWKKIQLSQVIQTGLQTPGIFKKYSEHLKENLGKRCTEVRSKIYKTRGGILEIST